MKFHQDNLKCKEITEKMISKTLTRVVTLEGQGQIILVDKILLVSKVYVQLFM